MRTAILIGALGLSLIPACNSGGEEPPPPPMVCRNIVGDLEAPNGVTLRKPNKEAAGCIENVISPEESECTPKDAPDLACVGQPRTAGTPISIIFTGCVSAFGLEAQSDDLSITILEESLNGTPVDPGYDLAGAPAEQAENTPNAVIAQTLSTAVPAEECSDRGAFSISGIPTETNLIIRVTDQHVPRDARAYVDTYQYNVMLRNDAIREGPEVDAPLVTDPATYCGQNDCYVNDDVNTVFEVTFTTVAVTAGVSQIEGDDDLYDGTGQGHLAGEVQDCTNQDTIQNAVIELGEDVRKLAYFNVGFPPTLGNLEDPKVEQTRSLTNADGLYAAIAVNTMDGGQPVAVAAGLTTSICGADGVCPCIDGAENPAYAGPDADEANSIVLGGRTVYIFPDSITILSFDRNVYEMQ